MLCTAVPGNTGGKEECFVGLDLLVYASEREPIRNGHSMFSCNSTVIVKTNRLEESGLQRCVAVDPGNYSMLTETVNRLSLW